MRERTLRDTFKELDLIFFSILAVVSEFMGTALLDSFNSDFYFSFSIALCLISMIRWGYAGVLVGIAGGAVSLWLSDMLLLQGFLFHMAANAALAIPILAFGNRDRTIITRRPIFLLGYILLSHLSLCAGKGIVIYFLTGEAYGAVDYFGASLFILIINMILCLVLRMRDGLICDMRYYYLKKEGEVNE